MTREEKRRRARRRKVLRKDLKILGISSVALAVLLGGGFVLKRRAAEKEMEAQRLVKEAELAKKQVVKEEKMAEEPAYVIPDFEVIYQLPELPTGCEMTAMSMVLQYWGYPVDKVTMATTYLPQVWGPGTYMGDDGNVYGNDMNNYFIGDPTTESGIACGTGAIIQATNSFLVDCGSTQTAIDGTGLEPEELYDLVRQDIPITVWCNIGMQERYVQDGWYTEYGEYVDWSMFDHGAVLIGVGPDTVTIADPLDGIVEYDREQFEYIYELRGKKCVYLN